MRVGPITPVRLGVRHASPSPVLARGQRPNDNSLETSDALQDEPIVASGFAGFICVERAGEAITPPFSLSTPLTASMSIKLCAQPLIPPAERPDTMYREKTNDRAIGGRLAMKPPVTSIPQSTL
jgi:hypothetical protein